MPDTGRVGKSRDAQRPARRVEEVAQMSEAGIRTLILDDSQVRDVIKTIEQDIRVLVEMGAVLVTVELLSRAQDNEC